MVDTLNRIQKLKAIKDPSVDRETPADETNSVLIPVTTQISFRDPKDDSKEVIFRFDNTDTSGRGAPFEGIARVQKVPHRVGTPDDYQEAEDEKLEVERPLRFGVVDPKENDPVYGNMIGTGFRLDNRDAPDSWPMLPEVYQLLKDLGLDFVRHVVRYTADNTLNGKPSVDVELIDILPVTDPKRDGQEHLYRMTYAALGPDLEDEDDPYKPTFAFADRALERYDEVLVAGDPPIDPPWRTSPLENIVNHDFGGALEYEPPFIPVDDPYNSPEMATTVQDNTAVNDCTKFLFSGYFNLPTGADIFSTDEIGEWMLMEWGGGALDTPGSPLTSRICVGGDFLDEGGFRYEVIAHIEGAATTAPYDLGNSFYGVTAAAADEDTEKKIFRNFKGKVTIGDATALAAFTNKWHHVAVSFDLDAAAGDFDEDPIEIQFQWIFESEGIIRVSPFEFITFAYSGSLSSRLFDLGITDPVGFPPGMDPFNIFYGSPVLDLRGVGTGHYDSAQLPDPNLHPRERLYVLSKNGLAFNDASDSNIYYGTALTAYPFVTTASDHTVPMKMTLDRGKKMNSDVSGSNALAPLNLAIQNSSIDDDREGVPVKNHQIAIPRKSQDKIASEGSQNVRIDIQTRLATYQVWFDKSVDIYEDAIADYFTTKFVSPTDSKQYIKAAGFTDADRAFMAAASLDPTTVLSRAALLISKPAIYMKGGPGKQDPLKPPGVRTGGFPQNKGTCGDFVTKNNVNTFSPGLGKILFPTA